MTVATGTYVGTATLIDRLGGTAVMGTADNSLLQTICDQVNTYIETYTGYVLSPIASGTVTFDIPETTTVLLLHDISGVRSLTSVEVADYTGASYGTVTSTDYFLRPLYPRPGWPYTELHLSDVPTGSITVFPPGYNTVRLVGTRGWAETPEDIEQVALTLAVRAWHSRQAGQSDIVGTDEMGQPVVSQLLNRRDRDTLNRYKKPPRAY
jgi:hypothetical protein